MNERPPRRPALEVLRRFADQVAEGPERPAVVAGGEETSYAALAAWVETLAADLRRRGVGPEARVGLLLERDASMVASVLAVLAAGGAYLPLDPHGPGERLGWMLEDGGARLLLSRPQLVATLRPPHLCSVVDPEELRPPTDRSATKLPRPGSSLLPDHRLEVASDPGEGSLAYLIYTSGSTGRPKGVEVPRRSLTRFLSAVEERIPVVPGERLLAVTSLSFDISVLEILLPLASGGTVVLASREEAADGGALARRLAESGATLFQATPSTWRLLLAAGWAGDSALRALCGGEALTPNLAAELTARAGEVWNLYGPTEATVWCTAWRLPREPQAARRVVLGSALPGVELRVVDDALQPVAASGVGELWVGGPVARGYAGQPGLSAQAFLPDPLGLSSGDRFYRTGDLVRRDADGELIFIGRRDAQLKIRGHRVEPGEVEAVLEEHPEVAQAAVVARSPTGEPPHLEAAVVLAADSELARLAAPGGAPRAVADALHPFLAARLPLHMLPTAIIPRSSLPRGVGGKLDRQRLAAGPGASPAEPPLEAPAETPAETTVLESTPFAAFSFLAGLLDLLLLPTASAVLLAWTVGETLARHPALAMAVAPLLYLLWLVIFLGLSALEMSLLGVAAPKPRYLRTADGWRATLRFLVAGKMYQRASLVLTLPLVSYLWRVPPFPWLLLRSYAPRAHLGRGAVLLGWVFDPDLVEIGPGVVIGGMAVVEGHIFQRSRSGGILYATAQVSLGARTTLGGGSTVGMGSRIGADALLEPGSVLPPFSRVGPGEVWGGNPAVFLRHRYDPPSGDAPGAAPGEAQGSAPGARHLDGDLEARSLVAEALGLAHEEVTPDLGSHNCPRWDSLGRMAIAAALHDRTGATLGPGEILRLTSVERVAAHLEPA